MRYSSYITEGSVWAPPRRYRCGPPYVFCPEGAYGHGLDGPRSMLTFRFSASLASGLQSSIWPSLSRNNIRDRFPPMSRHPVIHVVQKVLYGGVLCITHISRSYNCEFNFNVVESRHRRVPVQYNRQALQYSRDRATHHLVGRVQLFNSCEHLSLPFPYCLSDIGELRRTPEPRVVTLALSLPCRHRFISFLIMTQARNTPVELQLLHCTVRRFRKLRTRHGFIRITGESEMHTSKLVGIKICLRTLDNLIGKRARVPFPRPSGILCTSSQPDRTRST